jgi:hypothetical protein
MAVSVKPTVLWDVMLYSLVEIDQRFRLAYCIHHQGDTSKLSTKRQVKVGGPHPHSLILPSFDLVQPTPVSSTFSCTTCSSAWYGGSKNL